MNRLGYTLLSAVPLLLGGCFSVVDHQPMPPQAPSPAEVQHTLKQKTKSLKEEKGGTFSLPEALGGIIVSDSWVVYKDKAEEEFEGNVNYENGIYTFKAQYALSQRKQNKIFARGNLFVRKNNPDNSFYELYADKAVYNYHTGQGSAEADKKNTVRIVYQTTKGETMTADARQADFNTKEKIYFLSGEVLITHTDEKGQVSTLKAQQVTIRPQEQYLLLEGNAEAHNAGYILQSEAIVYNGAEHMAYAYGGRPLAQGTTPDGTFAIIADRVETDTDSREIKLSGRVQGWSVSEQINNSKANKNF